MGANNDGMRMASNHIYFKSIKGLNKKEYDDEFDARSYVEALLGSTPKDASENYKGEFISRIKVRPIKNKIISTIFVPRILHQTKEKEIWSWFGGVREVSDVILERKRDKNCWAHDMSIPI